MGLGPRFGLRFGLRFGFRYSHLCTWIRLESGVDGPVGVSPSAELVATDVGRCADGADVVVEVFVDSRDGFGGAGVDEFAFAHEVGARDGGRRVVEHGGGCAGERLELRGSKSIDVHTVEVVVGDDAGGANGLGPTISRGGSGSSDREDVVRHDETGRVVGAGVANVEGIVIVNGVVGLKDSVVGASGVAVIRSAFQRDRNTIVGVDDEIVHDGCSSTCIKGDIGMSRLSGVDDQISFDLVHR